MRQDDITNYTNDKAILEMHDFTNESADGDSAGYMACLLYTSPSPRD